MKTETYTLPEHWASTLINGDSSGNEDEDDKQIDDWLALHPHLGCCLDVSSDSGFRHFHDANEVGVLPCTCAEFTFPVIDTQDETEVSHQEFIEGYITAALWSSTDDNGEPLDRIFMTDDINPQTYTKMAEDCTDFINNNKPDLQQFCKEYKPGQGFSPDECAGHDFWLTRNGHGAGFWDRGLGELGDRLTKAAKTYGESDLYIGDDGQIYVA